MTQAHSRGMHRHKKKKENRFNDQGVFTHRPRDLNGGRAQDDWVVQANDDLAELLLHVPVVDALSRRTDVCRGSTASTLARRHHAVIKNERRLYCQMRKRGKNDKWI